ncbi:hypothetical protein Rhopal_003100-T1 [Rhodotorula paludigena]|uniref:DUF202 domain-containing protein n=1 Tax=Rhodotorula paludigena TaxID=86838 RepID=A0AAV5GKR4_9BASI|nr:hypothetical protein Rhopal_003100-T1 [Rhodotorula paludigena]
MSTDSSSHSRNFTRELHGRLVHRFPALFADLSGNAPAPAAGPSNYGATNGAPPADDGLQKLGADPSKIEPKVWLASERTLLSWFRVSLLLSSFALALFNSAGEHDWASRGMGMTYAIIACGMLGYAWTMHRVRRYRIVMRYGGHHDEPYGPVVVCVLIFLAVLVNFILRVRHREDLRDTPSPKNPWATTLELVRVGLNLQEPSGPL